MCDSINRGSKQTRIGEDDLTLAVSSRISVVAGLKVSIKIFPYLGKLFKEFVSDASCAALQCLIRCIDVIRMMMEGNRNLFLHVVDNILDYDGNTVAVIITFVDLIP